MSKTWWLALAATCAFSCGSDSSGKRDAGGDSRPADSRQIDAKAFMDGPPGTTPLTVKNFDAWCTVTVGSNAPSSSASQLVNVLPGTIALSATANTGFVLGLWHHTDGDTGSGDAGTLNGSASDATITVGATSTCVWVCCPFTNGTGCPTLEQCN
ncbi:MAG TPA: hypothetical protein VGF94_12485 [Kofleriaceae bacterium]|jgi:hypothetical protein